MPHLYFNEESDYSQENTCDIEVFCTTILHCIKKLNIFTLPLPIYYIQYQNRKSRFVLKQTLQKLTKGNRLPLLRGECNAYSFGINSQNAREAFHPPAFMGICPTITRVSLIYLVDEFFFLFLVQLDKTKRLGESKVPSFCLWC